MSEQYLKHFSELNDPNVTIIAMKGEGMIDDTYELYQVGYLEGFPGMVVQEDSWDEKKLISQIENSYNCLRKYEIMNNGIKLPEKLNYTVYYVSDEEFLSKVEGKDKKRSKYKDITLTLTEYPIEKKLKVQATHEYLTKDDLIYFLQKLIHTIETTDIMDGLEHNNGGYVEEFIKL